MSKPVTFHVNIADMDSVKELILDAYRKGFADGVNQLPTTVVHNHLRRQATTVVKAPNAKERR